jgi:mono/diheme cytochrome c family protein
MPLLLAVAVSVRCAAPAQTPAHGDAKPSSATIDFARDVRPILANHCWGCHGFDGGNRAAGLRLDVRAIAIAPLKNGHRAIVSGNLQDSAVVQRLFHENAARRMPPPQFSISCISQIHHCVPDGVGAALPS